MEGAGFGNYAVAQLKGAYQGPGVGQYPSETAAMPPQTLASAISSYDALHTKLCELTNKAHQLAAVVGGPFPVSGDPKQADTPRDSAVRRLNETANDCHRQITAINECLDAMARSLGA